MQHAALNLNHVYRYGAGIHTVCRPNHKPGQLLIRRHYSPQSEGLKELLERAPRGEVVYKRILSFLTRPHLRGSAFAKKSTFTSHTIIGGRTVNIVHMSEYYTRRSSSCLLM